ncbi:MAG: nitronate monooxygenase [Anaerolineae bacterium]|nr:nitronate monooxygenase [Anaerolineae bacterium]
MELPKIIQGGMGVAISDWKLARTVSLAGQLGVVSGTGLSRILIARLMDGDPDGHVRRALAQFPFQPDVQTILERYYIAGGKTPGTPYKNLAPYTLTPSRFINAITVIANFVEVYLAKEGHDGVVGINLLEKVQMPNMASLYGAMLAGVDYVLMGAGIPMQIPAILDKLARHETTFYRVDVDGAGPDDTYRIEFNAEATFPGSGAAFGPLRRPAFLPIISSVTLAQALLKRAEGSIEGFIIEGHIAGGHNAPPRGPLNLNDLGEPVYSDKDSVDLKKMQAFGRPFWLAGGYGSHEQLEDALAQGAAGIQVGTAFAMCEESGLERGLKETLREQVRTEEAVVFTDPLVSPTGFPFKVALIDGTMSDPAVYAARDRICDMGFLRRLYKRDDGQIGYRCPAEPVDDYVRKGGHAEDTEGRKCICNHLGATAGFPQTRKNGYVEPPIVTTGNDLVNTGRFFRPGSTAFSARDVIEVILHGQA